MSKSLAHSVWSNKEWRLHTVVPSFPNSSNSWQHWRTHVMRNRASLVQWQEDKLVAIGYLLTIKENKSNKIAFKKANKVDVIVPAGDDVLCPTDLKAVNGGYNKGTGHITKSSDDRNEGYIKR